MIKYVVFIILAIVFCRCIYTTNKHNRGVGIFTGVLFSFLVYYCIIPFFILLSYSEIDEKTSFITTVYESSFESYLLFFICALFLLLSMTISYRKSLLKYSSYIVSSARAKKYSSSFFYVSFIVGTLAFAIYISSFGGFVNALVTAEYIRSFDNATTDVIPYRAALMQLPSALVTASPLFYAVRTERIGVWRIKNIVFLIVLFLISVSYLLINAGKTGIILFILPIWLVFISYKTKHEWFCTILCCVLGVSLINVLDLLFLSFTNESVMLTDDALKADYSLLHQFAYPISNALNMHDILQSSNLRLFKDFITGFLTHVPGLNFEVSYVPTSAFYGGSNWRESGGVPNDIMTFGYLQLGPFGIVIVGYVWGYILGIIEQFLKKCTNSFADRFIKYSIVVTTFNAIMNADVVALVVNFKFSLVVLFICMAHYRLRPKSTSTI